MMLDLGYGKQREPLPNHHLRKELDERLKKSEEKISKDVSDSIKDLCNSITRVEDGKHDEIITLLKIHEKRDAQRMENIRQAFVG